MKFFKILFRSDKKIKMVYSEYTNKHSLGNDFYVLNFRFRNVLWYRINGQRTEKRQFIFSKHEAPKTVEILVYGFFRKKRFKMSLAQAIIEEKKIDELETQYSFSQT